MADKTLNPSDAQFASVASWPDDSPLVMVNLLKFKDVDEASGKTGAELYKEYMVAVAPLLEKAGGRVVWMGKAISAFIGPAEEGLWDKVLLVQYPNKMAFVGMVTEPDYPGSMREIALEDSRLWVCQAWSP